MTARKERTAVDLFCGAGGLSEGFRQAGFHIVAGNDHNEWAGVTFSKTHTDAAFIGGPIERLSGQSLLRAAGLRKGRLDCLIGGPPCQAFSVYNHQRGMHDGRSQLFREYLRIVDELQPNWVVMENVTGIISAGNGAAVRAIARGLNRLGYEVESRILKAEEYGVPQERRRLVFIGNRTGAPVLFPAPTHGGNLAPLTTIFDAISDLPALANGEDKGVTDYAAPAKTAYQRMLRGNSVEVRNHAAPRLAPVNLKRMSHIPQGGSWRDIPHHLLPAGMKKARRCDHTKRYGRMAWDSQSCTILTKCDLHWGAFVHPEQNRTVTVREAARIQSFPDRFHFEGPKTEQYVQAGNAVPPLLGKKIGEAVISAEELRAQNAGLRFALAG